MTMFGLVWLAAVIAQAVPPAVPPARRDESPVAAESQAGADLPVSLERIQRALQRPGPVQLEYDRPVFRVQVFGRTQMVQDYAGGRLRGTPYPHGSAAHQEFLEMVTPTDYRGYAAFTNREGAVVATTSFAYAMTFKAMRQLVRKAGEALERREAEALKKEIAAELAQLELQRKNVAKPPD